jgi:hypothetical protein
VHCYLAFMVWGDISLHFWLSEALVVGHLPEQHSKCNKVAFVWS